MPTIRLSKDEKCLAFMHHKKQTESVRWSLDGHVYWHCRASIKGMPWLPLSKPRYVMRFYPKIFFLLSASNSASVRTPDSCNAPSCFNCSRPSSVKPVGCAGVATCGGAGGGCWETGCAALLLLRVLLLLLRLFPGLSSSSDQQSILLAERPLVLIRLANAAKPLPYGSGKTKGGSPLLNENMSQFSSFHSCFFLYPFTSCLAVCFQHLRHSGPHTLQLRQHHLHAWSLPSSRWPRYLEQEQDRPQTSPRIVYNYWQRVCG